jgi:hypothetical protein
VPTSESPSQCRQPSFAGTAVRRWSSSTYSNAADRSGHPLLSERTHERHRVWVHNSTVGSSATRATRRRLRLSFQTGSLVLAESA